MPKSSQLAMLIVLMATLSLAAPRSKPHEPPQAVSDQQVASRIAAYLRPFVETGNFMGAVLVARKGRVLFGNAYGMANYELHVPNTPEIRFHIASVSKPFTALAILQLQEQGRLQVSDPVSHFLPDFPHGDRITLENLLTHTSGVPNVNNLPYYDSFARNPHALPELVAKFANLPLEFQPGTDYRYSNSNYNLLALVLERVTGENYGDYIRRHIFEPALMHNSGNDGNALSLIPLAASGYQPAGISAYEHAPYLDWSNKIGNGSLYSTLDDLYHFDRALNTDILIKAATRQKYFVEGRGNRYGWFIRRRLGRLVMSSNGRSPGFTAELDRFPEDDVTVIVLSNSYATVSQDPIAQALAAIVFGQQPSAPPGMRAAKISQTILESYAGSYRFGPEYFAPDAKVTITAEPGYLMQQLGDSRTALVPLSANDFFERNFFGHVDFATSSDGHVEKLTYHYGGKDYSARRLGEK